MVFFHSLPVPELREWVFSIPFPFPNFGNGIIHSCSRSRIPKCHSRSPLYSALVTQYKLTYKNVAHFLVRVRNVPRHSLSMSVSATDLASKIVSPASKIGLAHISLGELQRPVLLPECHTVQCHCLLFC